MARPRCSQDSALYDVYGRRRQRAGPGGPQHADNVDLHNQIFRAGLAYKFDFGKAVPAVTK